MTEIELIRKPEKWTSVTSYTEVRSNNARIQEKYVEGRVNYGLNQIDGR